MHACMLACTVRRYVQSLGIVKPLKINAETGGRLDLQYCTRYYCWEDLDQRVGRIYPAFGLDSNTAVCGFWGWGPKGKWDKICRWELEIFWKASRRKDFVFLPFWNIFFSYSSVMLVFGIEEDTVSWELMQDRVWEKLR
jgi:hypothetical protein